MNAGAYHDRMPSRASALAPRWSVATFVAAGVALVGTLTLLVVGFEGAAAPLIAGVVVVIAVAALGLWVVLAVRDRRRAIEAFAARTAADAALRERLAIARDLHDLASHHLVAITVRAAVALHVADDDPGEPRRALADIDGQARAATAELRRLVSVLRDADAAAPAGGHVTHAPDAPGAGSRAGSAPARIAPAPGIGRDDLDALAAAARERGIDVTLRSALDAEALDRIDASTQLAAYRVAQEALTNVSKHARASAGATAVRAEVSIDADAARLVVRVRDDGAARASGAAVAVDGTGFGLRGMRERVELHGGVLTAGARDDRGWSVEARFPLDAVAAGRPRRAAAP